MTLLAAYNFDEDSGNVLDYSGNGRVFALTGGLVRTASGGGKQGKGLTTVDGSADVGPPIFGQTALRSIMVDVKNTGSMAGWICEMHDTGADTGRWGLLCLTNSMGIRGTNTGGTTGHAVTARPTDNLYHNWCGTYDNSNVRTYLDGSQAGIQALAGPLATDADAYRIFTTASSLNTIDNLRVWDETLDPAVVAAIAGTAVSAGGVSQTLAQIAVEDVPLSLTSGKVQSLALGSVRDLAQSLSGSKQGALALAIVQDLVLGLSGSKSQRLALSGDLTDGLALSPRRQQTLALAVEQDITVALGAVKALSLGIATEQDIALTLDLGQGNNPTLRIWRHQDLVTPVLVGVVRKGVFTQATGWEVTGHGEG